MESQDKDSWSSDIDALNDLQKFNTRLSRLPRFKIRNRITPIALQSLLKISQIGSGRKLTKQGLKAENRRVTVDDQSVALRIIRPLGSIKGIVIDFHGGGWVIGNAQMNDDLNAKMAIECEVAVISVNYRLAVWTPIESIISDCLCAARWALSTSEFKDLPAIVVGESAGGHLAVATLLRLKAYPDLLTRVSGALLYYGVFDLTGTDSVRNAGPETLVLDGPGMVEALRLLTPGLTDEERRRPCLSPLYGDLQGFPPALMFAGELDPLRDDTQALAAKWRMSSAVEAHVVPHAPHGLIHFPTKMATKVIKYSHAWIRTQLAASSLA